MVAKHGNNQSGTKKVREGLRRLDKHWTSVGQLLDINGIGVLEVNKFLGKEYLLM